ncbi:MAG TPA: hypothetical protein VGO47_05260, partial [Chlamydiales bacterium]|nr:hypothetical protein [Chlamydiales bacterium]
MFLMAQEVNIFKYEVPRSREARELQVRGSAYVIFTVIYVSYSLRSLQASMVAPLPSTALINQRHASIAGKTLPASTSRRL